MVRHRIGTYQYNLRDVVMVTVIIQGSQVPGFAALFTMISFLSGLTIIILGIIGQYIWRIFDQLNGNPESVIDVD